MNLEPLSLQQLQAEEFEYYFTHTIKACADDLILPALAGEPEYNIGFIPSITATANGSDPALINGISLRHYNQEYSVLFATNLQGALEGFARLKYHPHNLRDDDYRTAELVIATTGKSKGLGKNVLLSTIFTARNLYNLTPQGNNSLKVIINDNNSKRMEGAPAHELVARQEMREKWERLLGKQGVLNLSGYGEDTFTIIHPSDALELNPTAAILRHITIREVPDSRYLNPQIIDTTTEPTQVDTKVLEMKERILQIISNTPS